jgi:ribulose bisphosphate carboxylase small subunit
VENFPEMSLPFVQSVLDLKDLDQTCKHHALIASARIVANSQSTPHPLMTTILNQMPTDKTGECVSLFWNKALDFSVDGEARHAIEWMDLARKFVSNLDTQTNAACLRFIAKCRFDLGELTDALSTIEEAIHWEESNSFGYLCKFRILIAMQKISEGLDMVTGLLRSNSHLEEFEPSFFTSIAAELFQISQVRLSLDCLLALLDLHKSLEPSVKVSVSVSVFSLLQKTEDEIMRLKAISTVIAAWNKDLVLDTEKKKAFAAVCFTTGITFRNLMKYEKAAVCFKAGTLFARSEIEFSGPCVCEHVKCLLRIGTEDSICEASLALESISDLMDSAPILIRDGLMLAKIKTDLANKQEVCALIDDITSSEALSELCEFVCSSKVDSRVITAILDRALRLNVIKDVIPALLHELIGCAKTKQELKEHFSFVMEFAERMDTDGLQFLMAKAWNTGVQLVKARRTKEGEWWFAQALAVMRKDKDLLELYEKDLEARYLKFLEYENSRLSLEFRSVAENI